MQMLALTQYHKTISRKGKFKKIEIRKQVLNSYHQKTVLFQTESLVILLCVDSLQEANGDVLLDGVAFSRLQ